MIAFIKEFIIKNITRVVTVLTVVALAFFLIKLIKEKNELVGTKEKYEQLNEYVAKLETRYVEEKELKTEIEKKFKKEISALRNQLKGLINSDFIVKSKEQIKERADYIGGDLIFQEVEHVTLDGKVGPPVGVVEIDKEGRVKSKLYDHKISVTNAISKDSSGKYTVLSRANYVLLEESLSNKKLVDKPSWLNKEYPLPISNGQAVIVPDDEQQQRFYLLSPHINVGVSAGVVSSAFDKGISVGISLSGYGFTERDLDWKFVDLGVDFMSESRARLLPVSYRFLRSVLKNTYLGPGISYGNSGISGLLNLSVGL